MLEVVISLDRRRDYPHRDLLHNLDLDIQTRALQYGIHPHGLPGHQSMPGQRRDRAAGVSRHQLGLAGDDQIRGQPGARAGDLDGRQYPRRRERRILCPCRTHRRSGADREPHARRKDLRCREGPQPARSEGRRRAAQLRRHQDAQATARKPRRLRPRNQGTTSAKASPPTA